MALVLYNDSLQNPGEKKKKNSERFFNEYYGIPDDAGEGMHLCSNDDLPGKFSIATYGTVLAGGTQ